MGHGDELRAIIHQPLQHRDIDLAHAVVRSDDDLHAPALRGLQEGDEIRGVLRDRRHDVVARCHVLGQAVEGLAPGHGSVLDERHLFLQAVQQARDRGVGRPHRGLRLRRVAADAGLEIEMAVQRVEHRPRHQARATAVEECQVLHGGRVGPGTCDIDHGACLDASRKARFNPVVTGGQIADLYPACRCWAFDPPALMESADPRLISPVGTLSLDHAGLANRGLTCLPPLRDEPCATSRRPSPLSVVGCPSQDVAWLKRANVSFFLSYHNIYP